MSGVNFAMSSEGWESLGIRKPDFSITQRSDDPFDGLERSGEPDFSGKQNVFDVVHSVVSGAEVDRELWIAASKALHRQKGRTDESDEEWAKRLADSFFEGL